MLASIAERKQPRGVCAAKVIKSADILQLSSLFFTFLAILLHKHTIFVDYLLIILYFCRRNEDWNNRIW